jgi:SOS regulatory protein LexA
MTSGKINSMPALDLRKTYAYRIKTISGDRHEPLDPEAEEDPRLHPVLRRPGRLSPLPAGDRPHLRFPLPGHRTELPGPSGTGGAAVQGLERQARAAGAAPEANALELPLVGTVAAGKPIEAIETPDSIEVPASMVGPGENFVLRVKGDSMVGDGILDGDFVVVRKQATADSGQTVVALIRGEATVKRLVRKGQRIELHPANPAMRPIVLEDEESFRIEGVVVGVIRHCL